MNNKISYLIKGFEDLFDDNNWLSISFNSALLDVGYILSITVPPGERNSIAVILYHILNWRTFLLRRLQGDGNFKMTQPISLRLNESVTNEEDWVNLQKQFNQSQIQIIEALKSTGENLLIQVVAQREYTFEYLINGIIQHDFYHLGQIVFIKKQLKQLHQNQI